MDDLIVIIVTLIIAGIGVLGQIKKRKPATQNNQQQNKSGGFWNMLENELNIREQPQEQFQEAEEEEETTEPVTETEGVETEKQYQFSPEEEGMSIYKIESVEELQEEEKVKPTKLRKSSVQFSLRKAVIFSEILNRKYE